MIQSSVEVRANQRGVHAITSEIVAALPGLRDFHQGVLFAFLQHTSASLTINENADPAVPEDLEMALTRIVSQDLPYRHTAEGPDDMPAHVKSSLIGPSVIVPICNGKLGLGTWQGIYLCEHRDRPTVRTIILTAWGD